MKGILFFFFITFVSSEPKCPPPTGEPILLPNPWDCTSYYECVGTTPVMEHCPPGLEWDNTNHRCDWPDTANCKETETRPPTVSTTQGTTVITTPKPTKCPEDQGDEEILLKNPEDCHSFFKCLKGKPILIKCPVGQEWADHLNRCDWPEVAKCTVETTTTTY